MSTNDKFRVLFDLGEPKQTDWLDYSQYGFNETDVPALLDLTADEALNQADTDSKEVWAPLHAWRALGQIGSGKSVEPLIALFDELVEDDYALSELPLVMGMTGEAAIAPLTAYLNERNHEEFARAMAADGLAEIAKRRPEYREQIIQHYQEYMNNPDVSTYNLNGLLVCCLLDLNAKEAIDEIRQLFAKNCVDISCAGDLEEVEIILGLRTERATPKPNFFIGNLNQSHKPQKPGDGDILDVIDYYLTEYGHDDSILDSSELDGLFAALACAPIDIVPSRWLPVIWGDAAPRWQNQKEFEEFSSAVFTLYNHVMQCLNEYDYQALFLERNIDDKTYTVVDEWCEGFLRGLKLWEPFPAKDAALLEQYIKPIKLFATETGYTKLDTMNEEEVVEQQQLIEPSVQRLYQHFRTQRLSANTPVVRETPKVGRNDPCPCGSGKKYKKCCLH